MKDHNLVVTMFLKSQLFPQKYIPQTSRNPQYCKIGEIAEQRDNTFFHFDENFKQHRLFLMQSLPSKCNHIDTERSANRVRNKEDGQGFGFTNGLAKVTGDLSTARDLKSKEAATRRV
jgi:hypothetical protein